MTYRWKKGRIRDLIESLESGVSVNGVNRVPADDEAAVLKVSAVTYGIFDPTAAKPIQGKELQRAKCTPGAGQIIISRASGTARHVGACAFIDRDYPNRFLPDKLWQSVPSLNVEVDLKWLFYFLTSPRTKARILNFATGTNIKNITQSELLAIPVSIPSFFEQISISDLLSTWDMAIEKNERLIQAKEKQLRGWIQRRISHKCDSWPHVRPDDLFDTISDKNFPDEELLSVTQDRGVIPRHMLKGRVMSPQGSTASYKLIKQGDFAISLRSFQGGIEYSRYQGIISPAYTVLRPKIDLDTGFYRLFFKSYIFIEKYLNLAVIGIRDGKQISIPDFMNIKISVPPIEEQQQIAETLSIAQQEIDLLKQLAEKYKTQKRGLMQKLLTGEWRVKINEEAV